MQISAPVYSLPGQTEGKSKVFFEWKSKDLSHELSLTCVVNVNYYKSVHHPIRTRENRKHTGNFQNKSVNSAFNWVSRYNLFLAKLKERGRPFLEGPRSGAHCEITLQEDLIVVRDEKVSPFVKFEKILSLLWFVLNRYRNKHCSTWSSMINLWIDSRACQK